MLCSQCGKEIPDNSKFCNLCGSKVKKREKQDTLINMPPTIVNTEISLKSQDTTQDKVLASSIMDNVENTKYETINNLNNSKHEEKKKKNGYGWLIICLFYVSFILNWIKNYEPSTYSTITLMVIFLSLPSVVILYFVLRNMFLERKYFIDKVWLSSFFSGLLSLIIMMLLIKIFTLISNS